MSKSAEIDIEVAHHVRDTCLCLHTQQAARAMARRFDQVLKPAGLNNGQFSLLMAISRREAANLGPLAEFLGMDRTTLTAKLKPLQRRGLLRIAIDEDDRRNRRIAITEAGRNTLARALPLWTAAHAEIERLFDGGADRLRQDLRRLREA